MSDFTFAVEGGQSLRLKTAGKYCQQDILVTADTDGFGQFWDIYQDNGNRTNYARVFTQAWNDQILKPKYPIKLQNAGAMFYESGIVNALANPGWLDMTACTSADSFARFASKMKECSLHIPLCTSLRQAFEYCSSLTKLTLTGILENCLFSGCFNVCSNLTELTVSGTIGQSIDLHWSPLDKASIQSVMAALSDTAEGMTVSFKKTAVNAAFTTDEWNALVAPKSNWTITLG